MVNFIFYSVGMDGFSEEESELLWSQDVSLDDWDYAFITYDINNFEYKEEERTDTIWDEKTQCYKTVQVMVEVLVPKDWYLERILTGCYQNVWKEIEWQGKRAVIGIAYHG